MAVKRVLVTGASGFVGSHLVEHLLELGHDVFGTTFSNSDWLSEVLGNDHVKVVDLTNTDDVSRLVEELKPDWIFHLAALASVGDSFGKALEVMENNTKVQFVMLEAVRQHSPSTRILCVGSATEYGPLPGQSGEGIDEDAPLYPNSPYAVSKMTQDYLSLSYYLAYKVDVIRVRPFNQIGPRQTGQFAVPAFAEQIVKIERGEQDKLMVGNLNATRDFTDVRDAVRAYVLLMEKGESGEVYNIGSGVGVSLQHVVDVLRGMAKTDIMVERDEARIRPVDVPVFTADITRLRRLGWQPEVPLQQSLLDILEYERKQEK